MKTGECEHSRSSKVRKNRHDSKVTFISSGITQEETRKNYKRVFLRDLRL